MNVQVAKSADYTIVSVEGRVDTTNAGEFEKSMMEVIDGGCTRLILNCSDLSYISSSGLRVFLIVQKKMTALRGQFRLSNLQPGIKEIFDISGFSSIFSVFTDQAAAIKG
ncbi:MAG: STAS domain-containing protein [Bacteroidales bacterium]|jgi:anti-anti-sigma factor